MPQQYACRRPERTEPPPRVCENENDRPEQRAQKAAQHTERLAVGLFRVQPVLFARAGKRRLVAALVYAERDIRLGGKHAALLDGRAAVRANVCAREPRFFQVRANFIEYVLRAGKHLARKLRADHKPEFYDAEIRNIQLVFFQILLDIGIHEKYKIHKYLCINHIFFLLSQ